MSEQEPQEYEQLFIRFSAKMERMLIRAVIVCLILLVCVQVLLQNAYIRRHFTRVEPLEGQPYIVAQPSSKERS
ncbi:DUF5359 family protein [Paenibacillus roseipurpureus]|uniref:DUF5359 family protein n=1 Tax=Paenibacillus roseopurpureus TaxID=2918901 RepID=A0AA96RIP5_9BACL|nr:DUF5359 family protein [Paenibacillus sp. MBLB1832]WNR42469.1 DUF5359 family protein [Paenibacillus sp. MBLB1832]